MVGIPTNVQVLVEEIDSCPYRIAGTPFLLNCTFMYATILPCKNTNYRRNWLLSACAYNTRQQENMRLIKSAKTRWVGRA